MYYFLGLVIVFVAGGVLAFFILRKNPKLLKIEKLTEQQLKDLQAKIKAKLGVK